MSYRISVRANADIEAICDFVAKDKPSAAGKLDQHMMMRLNCLRSFLAWDTVGQT